jgi:DNA polymerase-3 subunit alpha
MNDFVHLRVHTAHSLSEGAVPIGPLAALCKQHGMPAAAMTDSGTLAGAMEFTKTLSKAGVQPIMGVQLWLDHAPCTAEENGPSKIALLACDTEGYGNLVRLVSRAHKDREIDGVPAVSLKTLRDHTEGVIALTGGPEGPVDRALRLGAPERARQRLAAFQTLFGDRAYLEIQRHGLPSEDAVEPGLLELSEALQVPPVATNQAYFLQAENHRAHDALLAIAEGAYLSQTDRRRVTPEHYVKTPGQMAELFADLPEALDNTLTVAERCAVGFVSRKPILPPYPDLPAGKSEAEELADQARAGLEQRLAQVGKTDPEARAPYDSRLNDELAIITRMGFPGYFLIVADFIGWAKRQGIPVGPGRGSGAGSLVAWALTITDLDPLRYGLLFERFLNPDRVSMPDFDIDFCQERRDEVIDYVRSRYGAEKVAQIGTFGKLKARAALRAAGRVMQIPYPVVDRYCRMIPNNPSDPKTIPEALEIEPLASEYARAEDDIKAAFDIARQIEGLSSHASLHAAGVVIADRDVSELVPLMKDSHGQLATNYDMKAVEAAGMVKFDFLGLKTLDIIDGACRIAAEGGAEVDFARMDVDDAATYEMLRQADAFGVFQLESMGMRSAMRQIQPTRIEDIVALVSLYRPGPMDNIPVYAAIKAGDQEPDYMHPALADLLQETHGILVYQEQVMELARILAGYSLGQADLLRRAMGKKIQSEMDAQYAAFAEGASQGWVTLELDDGRSVTVHRASRLTGTDGASYTIDEARAAGVELAL